MKTVNHSFPVRPILRHIPRRTSLIRNATLNYGDEETNVFFRKERERERLLSTTPRVHFRSRRKTDRYLGASSAGGDT